MRPRISIRGCVRPSVRPSVDHPFFRKAKTNKNEEASLYTRVLVITMSNQSVKKTTEEMMIIEIIIEIEMIIDIIIEMGATS